MQPRFGLGRKLTQGAVAKGNEKGIKIGDLHTHSPYTQSRRVRALLRRMAAGNAIGGFGPRFNRADRKEKMSTCERVGDGGGVLNSKDLTRLQRKASNELPVEEGWFKRTNKAQK